MGVRNAVRPPSHVAYFVALTGILVLLLLLCCYFLYFCIKRVKELSREMEPACQPVRSAAPLTATYPIQPMARESATALARLCRQLPTATAVHPAASSPDATHTQTSPPAPEPAKEVAPPSLATFSEISAR